MLVGWWGGGAGDLIKKNIILCSRPGGNPPEDFSSEDLKCTGDPGTIIEGRKSFPSGHSSFSFAAWGFVFFYIAGKLGTFHCSRPISTWRLLLPLIFLLVPLSIALSRTSDYHHHWQDVLAGSVLGFAIIWMIYRQVGLPAS